jgi:heme ABC exporter ATP-binding subunit CcmA
VDGANAVELRGLVRGYGRRAVLKGLDLDLGAGKVVALFGSNGAGKTTLLRLLATRLRPSGGSAAVFGHDVVRAAHEVRRRIATLAVFGGAYATLSAREHLRLDAALRDHRLDEAEIDALLGRVGLHEAADALVRTYSSGMRKRLGLARLLASRSPLWLLDEPHAALDHDGQDLLDAVVGAARDDGVTVLMATHERERSRRLADASLVLDDGRLRRLDDREAP